VEVVWVEGNHDLGLTNVMSHLVGVKVYQDYAWNYAGLRHLAIHGHQFDGFAVNSVSLSSLGTWFYLLLQKLDLRGKPLARLIDRLNTRWLRMSAKVASGALAHARLHAADRIFCGHTHDAMHREQDGIHYYNSGGWIDSRLTYITIAEDGVHIHEFVENDEQNEKREAELPVTETTDEPELLEVIEHEA
jgi:UDP-2,3-diacylglucosamine pyrophosphatase LpxH